MNDCGICPNAVYHQVRIDIRQRLLHLRLHVWRISRCPNHDVVQVMRPHFAAFRVCLSEVCGLRLREEIHGWLRFPHARRKVAHVGGDTDDLVHSRVFPGSRAEVLPDGVFLDEEPFRKRLVDYCHRPRIGVVVVGERPSHHDPVSEGLKKSRRHAGPC